jgi:HEAT repeat protein
MPLVKKTEGVPPQSEDKADWREQLTLLQSGTPEERWSAARALASQPEAAVVLGDTLGQQTDPRLREAIFTSLAKLNSLASFDAALRHLRADDAELRTGALAAMVLMPEMIRVRLDGLLHDEDPDIRILACDFARHIPVDEGASVLANILTTEAAVNVCAAAIDVLAAIGSPAELPGLAHCADRFPSEVFLIFSIQAASDRIRSRNGV